jgi:glycyl-tRNA synthetase beta chain
MTKRAKADKHDLLVEIGVEELPARFAPKALADLESIVMRSFEDLRLAHGPVRVLGTPRRLAVIVEDVASGQEDSSSVVMGPPKKVAFDADGAPTKAAIGFAKGAGVEVGDLGVKDTGKGEYLYAEVHQVGAPAPEVLPAAIASWVESLAFPKSMVWLDSGFRFARPIRWLVALLGGEALRVEVAGIRSGVTTWGHRFIHGEIEIASAGEYVEALRGAGVIVDQDERRTLIEDGLERVCSELGGAPVGDEGLLNEVVFLVELPTVVAGSFDPSYADMPRDVVATAMKEHQRYFAVQKEDGTLLPNFVTVLNTAPEAVAGAIRGNERVLEARLADAKFYWDLDTGKSFEELLEGLGEVTWHAGFGTLRDKSNRLSDLAAFLAESWAPGSKDLVERAALYCKADLASDMVKDGKEFTGLQGAIGGEYAAAWGEPAEMGGAIRDHYMPRFATDALPESIEGVILSVADRVDNIAGGFAAGVAPTGSEDPYALRRAANGIIRMLLERELHISMAGLFERSCDLLGEYVGDGRGGLLDELHDYWVSRGDSYFAEKDVPYDIADAVLSVSFDDPVDSWSRCRALMSFRQDEDFSALVIGYKRAANILKKTEEGAGLEIGLDQLSEDAERGLFEAAETASLAVEKALSRADYESAIQSQLRLRPAIDKFFDDVMVMDKDPDVRCLRLGILRRVQAIFLKTWDLSRIALEAAQGE